MDRPVEVSTSEWLQGIPWQLFSTCKFPYPIERESACATMLKMTQSVAHTMQCRLGYVYTMERRDRTNTAIVPLHFHALFVAPKPLSAYLLADSWNNAVGRPNAGTGHLALVESYDSFSSGIEYITKHMTDPDCEFDQKNLGFFSSAIPNLLCHHVPSVAGRNSQQVRCEVYLATRSDRDARAACRLARRNGKGTNCATRS